MPAGKTFVVGTQRLQDRKYLHNQYIKLVNLRSRGGGGCRVAARSLWLGIATRARSGDAGVRGTGRGGGVVVIVWLVCVSVSVSM